MEPNQQTVATQPGAEEGSPPNNYGHPAHYAPRPDAPAPRVEPTDTGTAQTPKQRLLVRKLNTKDIGWLTLILDNARQNGRGKAEAIGRALETVDMLSVFALAWDDVEVDLTRWIGEVTGRNFTEPMEIEFLADVLEEMERDGGLGRFLKVLSRLQNPERSGQTDSGS